MSTPNHTTAVCANGPLDGGRHTGDAAKGFVLIDSSYNRVWVYDYDGVQYTGRSVGVRDDAALRQAQDDPGRQVRII